MTVHGEVKNYVPVTFEMLKNPPASDWLVFRGNYQGWSYSSLNQINRNNVQHLQLVWQWAMNDSGTNQTSPIVHNGILYLVSPSHIVQALDAKTGDLIWETRAGPYQAPGGSGSPIRSIGIMGDKILLPANNAHAVAINARNGEIMWDTPLSDVAGHATTSGTIVVGDKMLQGMTGCGPRQTDGCYISAIDVNSGKRLWRFQTRAQTGPEANTWGSLPMDQRGGGETWIAGTYDPELNLTYWGTAQAKPWSFMNRGTTLADKLLYTSSTVALNVDDGKLAWHHQFAPAESFDLDEVFERVLLDAGNRKLVFNAGKAGVLWKMDRQTGEFLGFKEMVKQTVWERIDPKTGVPTYRPDVFEMQYDKPINICPSTQGGKNWGAMSYNQPTDLLIVPLGQSCMDFLRAQDRRRRERSGPPIPGDARHQRQHRQARCVRRQYDAGSLESPTARGLPRWGHLDGRWHCHRRRHRSVRACSRCEDRKSVVADEVGDVGAGIPDHLQRGRQAIYRGDGGARRRQPAQCAWSDCT